MNCFPSVIDFSLPDERINFATPQKKDINAIEISIFNTIFITPATSFAKVLKSGNAKAADAISGVTNILNDSAFFIY